MLLVLLVDDEPEILTLARLFIEKEGSIAVDTALSAAEALGKMKEKQYDAVVSDYIMPDINGIEFLKMLRAQEDKTPFIIFTGKGREEVVIEAINNGASFYLQKGGDPSAQFAELIHKIKLAVLQNRTKQELVESEQKYRSLYSMVRLMCDNVPDLIWAKDPDGKYIFCNKAICEKILNASDTNEPIGKRDRYFGERERKRHQEETDWHNFDTRCRESDEVVMSSQKPGRFQECGRVKGDLLYLDVLKAPFWNDEHRMIGTVGCGRDVTQERLIAEALKESEEKYRALVENSLDGILIQDFAGTILFANQTIRRVLELDAAEEIIGKNSLDLLAPESREIAINDLMNVYRGLDGYLQEYTVRIPGGRELIIEGLGTKIQFRGNAANLLAIRDITGRKQAEEALMISNKKLNLLFSITRHDILNRLYVLSGYLELTRQQTTDPMIQSFVKAQTEAIDAIRHQIDFARDYENIGQSAPEWQNIRQILMDGLSYLNTGPVDIHVEVDGLELYADPLLPKVFYNLIENSIVHGESVSEISLSTRKSEYGLILIFEDNGCGIPGDRKTRIFERNAGGKSGLGLFLVREILSITNLSITESGDPGHGARFEIYVPAGQYRNTP
jgi:PAS domain S-box-containing protein